MPYYDLACAMHNSQPVMLKLVMVCRSVPQPAAPAQQLRSGGRHLAAALHPAADAGLGGGALPGRLPGGALWQPLGPGGPVQGEV